MPKDSLRHRADNLARLLADGRGAEILAELQKLGLETAGVRSTAATTSTPEAAVAASPDGGVLGAWRVAPTPDGPALHRRDLPPEELRSWADVEHVPAAGDATRVVLLGESSARGFLLDPLLTPAVALQRQLDAAGARHQVVDLAHTGADLRDLAQTLHQLPQAEPEVIVVYAGNNWVRSRHTPAHLDLLAEALRVGDYLAMRRAYLDRIVAPGIEQLLDRLSRTARACGSEVVVVIPEFNLRDWVHDPELELPPLPAKDLLTWSELRSEAEAAFDAGDDERVLTVTAAMARLDAGTSPVTGYLRARAAGRADDPRGARAALLDARDAVCGLLATHTPRITSGVRTALVEGAARRGFRTVDLAELLRADDGLPDTAHFLDYCHLSSTGIETTAAAVADVIAGHAPGRTAPQETLSAPDRAIGDLLAAIHNSYYAQRDDRVVSLVAGAVTVPEGRIFATSLLRLLESTGPVWASAAVPELTARPHAARYLAPMLSRSAETLGMWSLQQALREVVGRQDTLVPRGRAVGGTVDVLRTAEQGLIDGAFQSVDHRPERAFFQGFGPVTHLGFRAAAGTATVRLTYRVPAAIRQGDPVTVVVNGHHLGDLPSVASWTSADLSVGPGVLQDGVNRFELRWPCGGDDWPERRLADASRLARGDYPFVRAVQGELFDLAVEMHD
ncbi:hypothetical protein ABZ383_10875 [Streptomyces sp. NPDC005900]|uniref:hypothetical protein n=1 Tax=Streptomyces sp. NPDC005900 TaxID=3154569 RepID=UPI0033E8AAE6